MSWNPRLTGDGLTAEGVVALAKLIDHIQQHKRLFVANVDKRVNNRELFKSSSNELFVYFDSPCVHLCESTTSNCCTGVVMGSIVRSQGD